MLFLKMLGVKRTQESALISVVLGCFCSAFWCHFEYNIVFSYFKTQSKLSYSLDFMNQSNLTTFLSTMAQIKHRDFYHMSQT